MSTSFVQACDNATTVRLLSKVAQSSGCWEWRAAVSRDGYGYFMLNGKNERAHRASWLMFNKIPLDGKFILHKCDNRKCVNPDHLYAGSPANNVQDMMSRGRHRCTRVTHCPSGHAYSEENTRVYRGRRNCRSCARAAASLYMKRRRAKFVKAGLTTKGAEPRRAIND